MKALAGRQSQLWSAGGNGGSGEAVPGQLCQGWASPVPRSSLSQEPAWMDTQTWALQLGRKSVLSDGLKSVFWAVPVHRISHCMHPGARTRGK